MIIIIQCKDQVGLVSTVSSVLSKKNLNIVSTREHVDKAENMFFMRVEVEENQHGPFLEKELAELLPPQAIIAVNPQPDKKVVVMVTKEYHCLADILVRNHFGTLGASVQCVIGNHKVLQSVCERFGVPFSLVEYHENPTRSEEEILELISGYNPDYVVLAKFMRILSPTFVTKLKWKLINIHHSFLPAFAGANPYKKAFERGVKLIGATAHYVTDELDEGPIIAQQIIPVNHTFTTSDMVKAGREIETAVLAKALQLVFNDRVFVYRNKTVVFE